MRKVSDEQIIVAYEQTRNIWKAGAILGVAGQTVHRRLQAIGFRTKKPRFTSAELELIREAYEGAERVGDVGLKALAERLNRSEEGICTRALAMGLTRRSRPLHAERHERLEAGKLAAIKAKGHPRGFQGHKHSPDAKKVISDRAQAHWETMDEGARSDLSLRQLKTKIAKGGPNWQRPNASWKQGWQEIGGKRHYFRSSWEVKYAHWLEFRKTRLKEILEWEYECETFWFESIRRGTRSYTPDFKITNQDGSTYFDEVKGWMDERSVTKLKRMTKYHPHVKLNVIDKHWFASHKALAGVVPGWTA